jgi:outer membrane PBP1 activator LpoA protein
MSTKAWATAVWAAALLVGAARAQAGEAETALTKGLYARAETLLEHETTPEAALLKTRLWLATGRYDAAAELADSLAEHPGEVARQARLWAARAHLRRGRTGEARRGLTPLVEQRVPQALDLYATAAEAEGDHTSALRARHTLIALYNEGD